MSSTSKSAVSDYEHLRHGSVTGKIIGINESDDDELFLKAPTPKTLVDTLSSVFNNNNNNFPVNSIDINDKCDHFETVNSNIPMPSSYSPGVVLGFNPSLLITPEKSLKPLSDRDNNLEEPESHSVQKAPKPVPWSPGMRPEKSIFITPEKTENSKKNLDPTDKLKMSNQSQDMQHSVKGKQTVRFDLPSFSSGEDTFFDENSSLFSPVTIKGKEVNSLVSREDFSDSSPPYFSHKSYGTKNYDPNMYSDESTLDESTLTSNKSRPHDTLPHTQHTNISLSTSDHLVNKLKELMQDTNLSIAASMLRDTKSDEILTDDGNDRSNFKDSSLPKVKDNRGSNKGTSMPSNKLITQSRKTNTGLSSVVVIKESQSKARSQTSQNKSNRRDKKAGPHFLKDPVSVYHPPSAGSCIVKEPLCQIDSQEYSYPFHDEPKGDEDGIEHTFARPEFNSTLKFRQELDEIDEQEINVVRAVHEKLKQTNDVKADIQEKAASLTNCVSDQFSNLVNLDPPVDRLCDRVLRMRTSKAVKKKRAGPEKVTKVAASRAPVPDLMEFYSPDLQKETPGYSLHGMTPPTSDLLQAPTELAFDVYRHNRIWEGIHDF